MIRTILLSAALVLPGMAAITVGFNNAFQTGGGVSSNLADSSGTVQNGLVYGILVDGDGDGFLTQYDPDFNLTQGSLIDLTTNSGDATDDQLFVSLGLNGANAYQTSDTSLLVEGDGSTTGGDGGVIGFDDLSGDAALKAFALIWFDGGQAVDSNVNEGTSFGLLTDGSFVLPTDGALLVVYDDPFVGEDPVRSADFGAFTTIPEPSSLGLLLLGVLPLLGRRRR